MPDPAAWGRELLALRPAQPDRRSCGAAVLVVDEALADPAYARRVVAGGPRRFAEEVLAMHRRTTGPVDVGGRLQLPWPRALGTPPWAVARQLTARRGVRHVVRVVWPWRRRRSWQELVAAVRVAGPLPVYVGSPLLPRHVLLALPPEPPGTSGPEPDARLPRRPEPGPEEAVRVYDPAGGRTRTLPAGQFVAGRIAIGWPCPWFTVLPAPPARRTQA